MIVVVVGDFPDRLALVVKSMTLFIVKAFGDSDPTLGVLDDCTLQVLDIVGALIRVKWIPVTGRQLGNLGVSIFILHEPSRVHYAHEILVLHIVVDFLF